MSPVPAFLFYFDCLVPAYKDCVHRKLCRCTKEGQPNLKKEKHGPVYVVNCADYSSKQHALDNWIPKEGKNKP